MQKMKVKDLIAALQEIDPELEIYRFNSISCKPVYLEYAGWNFEKTTIAKAIGSEEKDEFYTKTSDEFYKKHQDQYEPPYEVVMIY